MIHPGEHTQVRDLVHTDVVTLCGDRSLREARRALLDLTSEASTPRVIIIIEEDGDYVGLITARLLFKRLLHDWDPNGVAHRDPEVLESELLDRIRERSALPVRDAVVKGIPTVSPEDQLHTLIEIGCDETIEYVPVVEDGRAVGVVPVMTILREAASLALRPDDDGIQLGEKKYT